MTDKTKKNVSESAILKIWQEAGYSVSLPTLVKKAKELVIPAPRQQLSEFLASRSSFQLTRKDNRQKYYASIVAPPKANLMVDIMVYDRYNIRGYKYI